MVTFCKSTFRLASHVMYVQVHAVDTLWTILPALRSYLASLKQSVEADDPEFPSERLLEVVASLSDMVSYVYTGNALRMCVWTCICVHVSILLKQTYRVNC